MTAPATRRRVLEAAALGALALVLFGPRLGHPFVTDDAIYIVENPAVVEGAPLGAYFTDRATVASNPDFQWQSYRPLRTLAFRAVARLAGVQPLPFGIANLALYLAGALLALGLGRRLGLGDGALWGAALWVAAPVHVEPVLYASALGDHLSLVLELAGLWLALDALGVCRSNQGCPVVPVPVPLPVPRSGLRAGATGPGTGTGTGTAGTGPDHSPLAGPREARKPGYDNNRPAGRPRATLRVVLGWLLVTAAMFTKEMAVTAPALLALLAWATGAPRRRAAWLVASYAAAALLFVGARTAVLAAFGHGAVTTSGALGQLAMVPWRLGAYLGIVVAPLGHSAAYVLPWPGAGWLALAWAGLAAVAVLLRWAPPPARVGAAWFAVALAPVLGIVPVFADLADRFALLPSVGLVWMVPVGLAALARRWRLAPLVPALLLLVYGAGSLVEGLAWRDEATLWAKAVDLQPRSAHAHRNLGLIRLQRGDPPAALRHFDEARRLGEQAGELDRRRAMALEALGRFPEAEAAAADAITRDHELGPAYALYGGLVARRGALEEAEQALARAQRYAPDHPSTWLLEVEIAARSGQVERELAAEGRLVGRYPAEPRFLYRRAETRLRTGDARGAAEDASACLRLAPGNAQCLCLSGSAKEKLGEPVTAAEHAACSPSPSR